MSNRAKNFIGLIILLALASLAYYQCGPYPENYFPSQGSPAEIESIAIGKLKTIYKAQVDFREKVIIDQNEDGVGEFGNLPELGCIDKSRFRGSAYDTSPLINSKLATIDENGVSEWSSYCYKIYFPEKKQKIGSKYPENNFYVYAWPSKVGSNLSGKRIFVMNGIGEIYFRNISEYSGRGEVPEASYALCDTDGNQIKELGPDRIDKSKWTIVPILRK